MRTVGIVDGRGYRQWIAIFGVRGTGECLVSNGLSRNSRKIGIYIKTITSRSCSDISHSVSCSNSPTVTSRIRRESSECLRSSARYDRSIRLSYTSCGTSTSIEYFEVIASYTRSISVVI